MIGRDEIVQSLTGAWEIFLDRADAMTRFDLSVEGFWRSFQAILLVIPSYLVITVGEHAILSTFAAENKLPAFDDSSFYLSRAVGLVVFWLALPAILAVVAKPFGIGDRYGAFVVARNWSLVLIMLPYAAVAVLFGLGLFSTTLASFVSLLALVVALRFMYLVARHSLMVPMGFAIAIAVFDFVISLFIEVGVNALFGLGAKAV